MYSPCILLCKDVSPECNDLAS